MVTVILDSVRDALTFWHFVRFILVFSEIFLASCLHYMDCSFISMRGIGKVKRDGPILIKISEKTEGWKFWLIFIEVKDKIKQEKS